MNSMDDYPLSIFREALVSVVGRVFSFLLATGLAFWAADRLLAGTLDFDLPSFLLLWSVAPVAALFQFWGFLTYGLLALLFVWHVHLERPFWLTLPAAVLVQWIERIRLEAGISMGSSSPLRVKVALCVWALLCLGFLALLFRGRCLFPVLRRRDALRG